MPATYWEKTKKKFGYYSEDEYKLMQKYFKPRILDEEDRGLVRMLNGDIAISPSETPGVDIGYVSSTGMRYYRRSNSLSSIVGRWLYKLHCKLC